MKPAQEHKRPFFRRFLARICSIVAESSYAQHRVAELRFAPDRYVLGRTNAPDTYAEFLFRTSGPLRHEPPARKRLASR